MRIRGGHIAGLAVGAIFAFVIYAVFTVPEPPPAPTPAATGGGMGPTNPLPPGFGGDSGGVDPDRISQGVGTLPPADMSDDYAARLEVETDHLHVGVVPHDKVSHHDLKIWNRGRVPLKISSIRTTCPCTEGTIANGTVAPGAEAVIDVAIDPKRISGFDSTKTLSIFSNDPKHGVLEVKVTAEVDPEFEVTPSPLYFGTIEKGSEEPLLMTMRQLEEEPPLEVTGAETLDRLLADTKLDDLKLEVEPVPAAERRDPEKNEFIIRITPTPLLPPGPFVRRIAVSTNVERLQGYPAEFEVGGEVVAPYTVSPVYPERLVIRPGQDATTTITVSAGEPVEIFDPHYDTEKIDVAIRNEGNTAYLDLRAASGAPSGRLESELRYSVRVGGQTYFERTGVLRTFAGQPAHQH